MRCMNILLLVSATVLGTSVIIPVGRAGQIQPRSADSVSFRSLLADMVNRDLLARSPDPYYTCHQSSSYERTSVSPNQSGWYANRDWSHFIRAEYSYGNAAFFEAPFQAQPHGKGNNSIAYSTNTRTRSLDAIPFQKSLCLDMELWHWASTKLNCAVATYWYATHDSTCNVSSDIAAAAARTDPEVSQ